LQNFALWLRNSSNRWPRWFNQRKRNKAYL
jgi:hypothetical protein